MWTSNAAETRPAPHEEQVTEKIGFASHDLWFEADEFEPFYDDYVGAALDETTYLEVVKVFPRDPPRRAVSPKGEFVICLLYTSDAADD